MFAPVAVLVLAATSAFALPRSLPRADDPCAKFGGAAFGNAGPFTMVTLDLSNRTNLLILGPAVGAGSSDPSRRSLVTVETFPTADTPTYKLVNGGLFAMTNNVTVGAAGLAPASGAPVYFEVGSTDAAQVYCGVVGTSPAGHDPANPALVVPGGSNGFAICNATSSASKSPLQVLIFDAENNANQGYDFSTCNPVTVQLVGA
ncbi:hypothetical protein BD310DRAFT_932005 [Dichomitus squalens]|uniref:Ubiquitin 3 binding protein But2 C-terminal domain-containing protein n=1 Tax=Dichomitus squalens TaxID=114155 RepID=A0A4Q9PPB0_9APHY|nr:hypothetical protein BD310DRAFT_932005 [Dichomitus squalens]